MGSCQGSWTVWDIRHFGLRIFNRAATDRWRTVLFVQLDDISWDDESKEGFESYAKNGEQQEKEHNKRTQVLECLCEVCWLKAYINGLVRFRSVCKGLQTAAYVLRSDLNVILSSLKTCDLEDSTLELWGAEKKLGFPTVKDLSLEMSKASRSLFEPTQLKQRIIKLHMFSKRSNYLTCMKTLERATIHSIQA